MGCGDGRLVPDVFVALVKAEPEWREVTIDHSDVRLGGYVLGGEPSRLTCANYHTPEEVGLKGSEVHAFLMGEDEEIPASLIEIRLVREETAVWHMRRRREGGKPPHFAVFHASDEIALAKSSGDDAVEGAVALLCALLDSLPAPWVLTRVARSARTGSLWAFALNAAGELVLGSYDVESRQLRVPPSLIYLSRQGHEVMQELLDDAGDLRPGLPGDPLAGLLGDP